jgi:hypothetical protein
MAPCIHNLGLGGFEHLLEDPSRTLDTKRATGLGEVDCVLCRRRDLHASTAVTVFCGPLLAVWRLVPRLRRLERRLQQCLS